MISTKNIIYRQAKKNDFPELINYSNVPNFKELYVAMDGNKIAGISRFKGNVLSKIMVTPEYRGNWSGVFKNLLEFSVEKHFKKNKTFPVICFEAVVSKRENRDNKKRQKTLELLYLKMGAVRDKYTFYFFRPKANETLVGAKSRHMKKGVLIKSPAEMHLLMMKKAAARHLKRKPIRKPR